VSKRASSPGGAEVTDDEGPLTDAPEAFALGEFGELVGFDGGEAEDAADGGGLVVGLVVEDAGGGVTEESLGQAAGLGAGVAGPRTPTRARTESRPTMPPPSPCSAPVKRDWMPTDSPGDCRSPRIRRKHSGPRVLADSGNCSVFAEP
jgi:hypothetical protein